jgi:transcription antitermination factor NusG
MVAEKQLNWFVVKTRSRAEQKVAQRISAKGLNVYLPLQKTIRQWSDRKKKVEVPLISSTLFIYLEEKDLSVLFNIPGFHSILHFLGKPAIVREDEINNLKLLLKEDIKIENGNFEEFKKGESIEVIRGPLQGIIATSIDEGRTHKLIVEIESMEQRFIVHIPKSCVRKVNV